MVNGVFEVSKNTLNSSEVILGGAMHELRKLVTSEADIRTSEREVLESPDDASVDRWVRCRRVTAERQRRGV